MSTNDVQLHNIEQNNTIITFTPWLDVRFIGHFEFMLSYKTQHNSYTVKVWPFKFSTTGLSINRLLTLLKYLVRNVNYEFKK